MNKDGNWAIVLTFYNCLLRCILYYAEEKARFCKKNR